MPARCHRSQTLGVARAGRHRQRGQALIETAIVVIFAMTLFVGVYAVSVAISDSTIAGEGVRSGARFGAQVGNNNYTQSGALATCQGGVNTNPCFIDGQILANVAAATKDLNFATVTDVVIYNPNGGGASNTCASGTTPTSPYIVGEHAEKYTPNGSGGWNGGPVSAGAYSLDQRLQLHPNEGAIGVQLDFNYRSPTPLIGVTLNHTEFTVNCFAPSSH